MSRATLSIGLVLLLPVTLAGDAGSTLTRESARDLITQAPSFWIPVHVESQGGGLVCDGGAKFDRVCPTLSEILVETGYFVQSEDGHLEMTSKGEAASKEGPAWQIYRGWIPIAMKRLVEVTGITVGDGITKRASFTWQWIPTPVLAEAIEHKPTLASKLRLDRTYEGMAWFELWDDGWRVETVEVYGG